MGDQALSLAVTQNEDDLLKGAYRTYPFLKKSEKTIEYGFRLKEFPDDPVKLVNKDAKEQSDNPIMNWFNALDNPLNDGSGWGKPMNRATSGARTGEFVSMRASLATLSRSASQSLLHFTEAWRLGGGSQRRIHIVGIGC